MRPAVQRASRRKASANAQANAARPPLIDPGPEVPTGWHPRPTPRRAEKNTQEGLRGQGVPTRWHLSSLMLDCHVRSV
jgi:hypothetical protein